MLSETLEMPDNSEPFSITLNKKLIKLHEDKYEKILYVVKLQ